MRPALLCLVGLQAATLVVASGGCAGGGPSVSSSLTEATVSGTVSVNGMPATAGEVVFDASNIKRPNETARTAPIGSGGIYKIRTLVGANTVRITGGPVDQFPDLAYESLGFDVKEGENTFNIQLHASMPSGEGQASSEDQ